MLLPGVAVQTPPSGTLRVRVILRLNGEPGQHYTTEDVHPRSKGPPSSFQLLAVPLRVVGKPIVRPDPLLSTRPVGAHSEPTLSTLVGGGVFALLAREVTPSGLVLPGRARLAPGGVPVGQGVLWPQGGRGFGLDGAAGQRGQAEVEGFLLWVEAVTTVAQGWVFRERRPRAVAVTRRVSPGQVAAVPVKQQEVAAVT